MDNTSLYFIDIENSIIDTLYASGLRTIKDMILFRHLNAPDRLLKPKLKQLNIRLEDYNKVQERVDQFLNEHKTSQVFKSNLDGISLDFLRFGYKPNSMIEERRDHDTIISSKCITQITSQLKAGKTDMW